MKEKETMKKLMIAAAAVAMIGSAFAEAQVYDVKLSVKTTDCKAGKANKAIEEFFGIAKGTKIQYRKQASKTIKGLIWGCDCKAIAAPAWSVRVSPKGLAFSGYQFWLEDKAAIPFNVPYVSFDWLLLNRIDQMTKVEGTWQLKDKAAGEAFYFLGAGFGSCKNVYNNLGADCESYISSMSGSFAGWTEKVGGIVDIIEGDDCVFCGGTPDIPVALPCLVGPFCYCYTVATFNPMLTAAYGTWSIKYNSSASKKLKKELSVTKAVKLSSKKLAAVEASIKAAEVAAANAWAVAPADEFPIKDSFILLNDYLKAAAIKDPGKAVDQTIDYLGVKFSLKDSLAAKIADLS